MIDIKDFPIERLEKETPKAFQAFTQYCQLDPSERSIDAAYLSANNRETNGKKNIKCHWQQWSTKFNWPERAAKYDEFLAKQALGSLIDCRHKSIEEFHQRSKETYQIAEETGQILLKAIATSIKKRTQNDKVLEAGEAQKWASAYHSICSGGKLNRDLFAELLGLDIIANKIEKSNEN